MRNFKYVKENGMTVKSFATSFARSQAIKSLKQLGYNYFYCDEHIRPFSTPFCLEYGIDTNFPDDIVEIGNETDMRIRVTSMDPINKHRVNEQNLLENVARFKKVHHLIEV